MSAYGRLRVDLSALAANYQYLTEAAAPARCGAVVKANAYGLGVGPVVTKLINCGCTHFFVANIPEGRQIRQLNADAKVYVFSGVDKASAADCAQLGLVPVLNHAIQIQAWAPYQQPAAVHVDTGMERLGFPVEQMCIAELKRTNIELLLTHLACADTPDHPLNCEQVQRFVAVAKRYRNVPTSIGNSAGTLMGPQYRGDLCRPGIAIYGGNPFVNEPNPMQPVVFLEGTVLQLRSVEARKSVGYGATDTADSQRLLAVVGVGYADGVPRLLSNRGFAGFNGCRLPIVGRISMDLTHIDVTAVADQIKVGDMVEFIGMTISVDDMAAWAQTISYEVLTGLGQRLERQYITS